MYWSPAKLFGTDAHVRDGTLVFHAGGSPSAHSAGPLQLLQLTQRRTGQEMRRETGRRRGDMIRIKIFGRGSGFIMSVSGIEFEDGWDRRVLV